MSAENPGAGSARDQSAEWKSEKPYAVERIDVKIQRRLCFETRTNQDLSLLHFTPDCSKYLHTIFTGLSICNKTT